MYDPSKIEPKWQSYWAKHKTFRSSIDKKKPKYYVLDMFPYPSGAGLHVGHPEGYTATDIICRYKRMKGVNVLHPMGWDAFGLPAENYAIKTGRHPSEVTAENIATFKRQIQAIGFSYDWDREINTTDSDYYKWTQWIFLQLYKKGLAYESELPINWCPGCKTGLANEEVIDGKCDRCKSQTTKKLLRQWVLRITQYADRLVDDLESLDWPEPIKQMQRNWIGKSVGANVKFEIRCEDSRLRGNEKKGKSKTVEVFTTRPDTLFGATYLVLSPEHPLVYELVDKKHAKEVEKYKEFSLMKSDLERTDLNKDKTGQFIGAYAINPVNGKEIPIWIADYVLMGYGTGAIMAVPAHDERDWEFAKKFKLPILEVVKGGDVQKTAYTGDGILVNSTFLDGLDAEQAKFKMIRWLEEKGIGDGAVNYRMKDWVFSRQRYWGEPIPVVHCEKCGPVPVPEKELPLKLPDVKNYQPTGTGESPLAAMDDWVNTKCPVCKGPAKRETNTMPQWGGSCWYYLRFLSPWDKKSFADKKEQDYWMNVDLYVGGAEHAVLHLLYARFWHKVLFDLGFVKDKEPFQRLMNQGMILGEDNEKMSKSRGNVINPDDVIRQYGADTLRLYEMFMGPFEAVKPWSTKGIEGSFRFLQKVWRFLEEGAVTDESDSPAIRKALHKTVKKVGEDIEGLHFNTAISQMMILANDAMKEKKLSKSFLETFALILSPFAPHMSEELWEKLGHKSTLAYEPWPAYDPALVVDDAFELVLSVNGKKRSSKQVAMGISEADAIKEALADPLVQKYLVGTTVIKKIYVPGKLVNIVVK
jgi:leucyl-tRNA synthetase